MAIQTSDFDFDPFAKAIPGQSFTATPGKRPFETVPQTSSPQQALDAVKQSLEDPIAMKTTIKLLDAGISAETISSAMVLKMFTEGMFTPDVSEIIKPPLSAHIIDLGTEAGIEDMNVVNNIPGEDFSSDESLQLMQQVNPDKFKRQMTQQFEDNQMSEFAEQVEFPEEIEPMSESFLDMEVT